MTLTRVMSIKEFCDEYGVGTTQCYEEVKRGRIRLRKLGRKSLITRDEAERWLENLPTSGADRDPWDGDAQGENQLSPVSTVGLDQKLGARIGEEPLARPSVKPSHPVAHDNLKDELIRRGCEVWQPRLGRDLSREEVRQIAANIAGFFTILAEWSRAELPAPANDTGKLDAPENDYGAPGAAAGACHDR